MLLDRQLTCDTVSLDRQLTCDTVSLDELLTCDTVSLDERLTCDAVSLYRQLTCDNVSLDWQLTCGTVSLDKLTVFQSSVAPSCWKHWQILTQNMLPHSTKIDSSAHCENLRSASHILCLSLPH